MAIVNSVDELRLFLGMGGKVLVAFSRKSGCVWCARLHPHFVAASALVPDTKFVIAYVDGDSAEYDKVTLAEQYDIMAVPTLWLFEHSVRTAEVKGRTAVQIITEINNTNPKEQNV